MRRAYLPCMMNWLARLVLIGSASAFVFAGCGGTSSSSSAMPPQAASAHVRFIDGAPSLETLINGVPQDIGTAYLQLGGKTVASLFTYGSISPFTLVPPGPQSLTARDELGYAVGPLKTAALTGGNHYTLIVVGAYPHYRVLVFEEPKNTNGAQLSFYEASPTVPSADFGSFRASSRSNFKTLGRAHLGSVATVPLGAKVSNIGGFVGPSNAPIGTVTPAQIDAFDSRNALPFHAASRLSLFLLDVKSGTAIGPVIGSLDR